MAGAPHPTPRGSAYLRNAATFRGLSVAGVERLLDQAGVASGEARRLAHLALFGLWLELAEHATTAAAWTGVVTPDPTALGAVLGLSATDLTHGLAVAVECGALEGYKSARETRALSAALAAGVLSPATDPEAVVAWDRCVRALRARPAAIQGCRALAALTTRPAELAPARLEDLAALAHYSPNALRPGLQEAVRAGVLIAGGAGRRREYAFTDWALGRGEGVAPGATSPSPGSRRTTAAPAAPAATPPAPAGGAPREMVPLTIGDVAVTVPKGLTVSITRKRTGHEDETFVIRVDD